MQKIKVLVFFLYVISLDVLAELNIEITQGVQDPTPIAIVPFSGTVTSTSVNVAEIVEADLQRSGLFRTIARSDMLSLPSSEAQVFYRDWRVLGTSFLVIGTVQAVPDSSASFVVDYELYDVLAQKRIFKKVVSTNLNSMRDAAHEVADEIYSAITGIRGVFSTKILYVEDLGSKVSQQYRLMLADADGARERVVFESSEPILSPSWSNDMSQVAYVSFETSRPAIFRHNLITNRREQLTNFKGLNSAPAWSPDDKYLALVLSKDGNPELYTLEVATKKLKRITRQAGIDTEPNWTKDGKSLIFTSNRGGSPQIYQIGLASGRLERLTFDGNYNARPRLSPDGKSFVMVHRYDDVFHIALQEISSGDIRVLTQTLLDESPTIAPNGAMLLYATQQNNKGVLAAVSLDAGVKYLLPSKRGNVREPAWSPFK